MADYTEDEQNYLERLSAIKGITFLSFETIDDLPMFRASHRISYIDKRQHSQYDLDDWVMRMMKRERIKGEFFLRMGYAPYARVILPRPFWWACAYHLRLISLEKDYLLQVGNGEYDGYGDSYVNYKEAYRWIKPPANSPAFWG